MSQNGESSQNGHNAVCSSVLVPCTNKCGVYTARANLPDHLQKCPNSIRRGQIHENSNQELESSLNTLTLPIRTNPNSEANSTPNYDVQSPPTPTKPVFNDLQSLQSRCSKLEQYFSRLAEFHKNKTFIESEEIERLTIHNRLLEEWRDIMNVKLDQLRQELREHESSKSETLDHWRNLRQHLVDFEKLKIDVCNIREDLCIQIKEGRLQDAELSQEIIGLVEVIDRQHTFILTSFRGNDENMTETNNRISQCRGDISVMNANIMRLNFELKALTRMATADEDKVEILERRFGEIERDVRQIRVDLEIAEENPDNNLPIGRILWKIINVNGRLQNAKENGTILKSPIFYSHQFGYKIRIYLYLNGLNQWKDRNALFCIQVLKGEYDAILKWPCNIEGTVKLRDTVNFENPRHYCKSITAKCNHPDEETEDLQEASQTFLFISHRVLMQPTYLKADTLFLDIKINRLSQQTDF